MLSSFLLFFFSFRFLYLELPIDRALLQPWCALFLILIEFVTLSKAQHLLSSCKGTQIYRPEPDPEQEQQWPEHQEPELRFSQRFRTRNRTRTPGYWLDPEKDLRTDCRTHWMLHSKIYDQEPQNKKSPNRTSALWHHNDQQDPPMRILTI